MALTYIDDGVDELVDPKLRALLIDRVTDMEQYIRAALEMVYVKAVNRGAQPGDVAQGLRDWFAFYLTCFATPEEIDDYTDWVKDAAHYWQQEREEAEAVKAKAERDSAPTLAVVAEAAD